MISNVTLFSEDFSQDCLGKVSANSVDVEVCTQQ